MKKGNKNKSTQYHKSVHSITNNCQTKKNLLKLRKKKGLIKNRPKFMKNLH